VSSELTICDEVLFEVSHHLLTRSGDRSKITKVYSRPQAIEQCRTWFDHNLPGIPIVDVSNTARAAVLAAEDTTAAAVAGDLAASMYGLRIAASNLDDLGRNITRFLVIGRDAPAPTDRDRTSIMFALDDAPGVLYRALKSFADRGINMSRIESRPSHREAWEYLFFVDLEGHSQDPRVAEAVQDLAGVCAFMKVLGSYPQGRLASRLLPRKTR
jgi:chorismate mutase/prephenate dehydratase